MGSTINPRARGGASLSGELKSSRDDRQQIRRLFSATPKPAAPSGGGSVAGVRWRAFNTTGSAGTTPGTSATMDFDPSASGIQPTQLGPNAAPGFTFTGGEFVAATAGFYDFALNAQLVFGADPGKVYLSWGGPDDGGLFLTQTWTTVGFSEPAAGQLQARDTYRTFLPAGGGLAFGWAWDNATTLHIPDGILDIYRMG